MATAHFGTAEPRLNAVGIVQHPAFTDEDFAAIKQRADLVTDQTIKTDLFRLIIELEKHRGR